jgi:predicted DNA-binding transcriptional regulator AlpA
MEKQEKTQNNRTQKPLAIPAKEVARLLGVSVRQVWRLNSMGKLPKPLRLNGSVRWSLKEVEAFVKAGAPDRQTWEALKANRGKKRC